MKTRLKIPRQLIVSMRADLHRSHEFAYERVGFMVAGAALTARDEVLLVARSYAPVDDADYVRNRRVGAMIGSDAMRKAMQLAYQYRSSLWHVHMHRGHGVPGFSSVDLASGSEFVPAFAHSLARMPHGMIVINEDWATAMMWIDPQRPGIAVDEITVVGAPYERNGRLL